MISNSLGAADPQATYLPGAGAVELVEIARSQFYKWSWAKIRNPRDQSSWLYRVVSEPIEGATFSEFTDFKSKIAALKFGADAAEGAKKAGA